MPSFSIGFPAHERISVSLTGTPADPKTEGYDWITANVEIKAGGFTGAAQIYMCVSDMVRFKEQLDPLFRTLAGVAEFKTIEDQFYARVEGDGLGHLHATGFLIDTFADGNELRFDIGFDQTLLSHTISEIEAALSELAQTTV